MRSSPRSWSGSGGLAVRPVRVELVDRDQGAIGSATGPLDRLAAAGEPVDDRGHPGDLETLLQHPLDRADGRPAGRDDVLDDQAPGSRLEHWSLDPPLESVLLALPANEEGDEVIADIR